MLRQRVVSAAILIPPLVVILLLGGPWIAAAIALVTAGAAIETFRLLRAAGYPSLQVIGTLLAVAVVADAALPVPIEGSGLILVAIGAILIAIGAFAADDPRVGLATWMTTLFGAIYAALLSFVVRLGEIAPALPATAPLQVIEAQRGWILLLVLAVWSYDTGAYFAGRRFGRHRFLAHISPSKTYAGLVGGVLATTVVVTLMLAALGQAPIGGLVLGPLVAFAAQGGDLAESMLKRAAGAKDSSNLIPGHGGLLDRLDSFLFAAPIVVLYVLVAAS